MLRQKYKAPLSIKSPEPKAKGDVDIRGGNYSKGLNKQDVNLTDRLLDDVDEGRSSCCGTMDGKGGCPPPVLPSESPGEESRRA